MENKLKLKETIFSMIEAGKKLSVKWNCGGDEAIITVFENNERLKFDHPFAMELDLYLINYLNLPDVGEFDLEGGGEIIKENEEIYIVYESILKGMEDYESENGGWKEINERDETFSGKKRLFKE